jgi:F-type H+-transporting ATPase subunit h
MYLKELKAYKPPPQKASDAEAHVTKFSPPAAPKSPEESNLANEMKDYEDQVVEVEGAAATGETQAPEEDYFEDLKQFDEEPVHH